MPKEKPKWDKPELIVLVRGKPDEMVLGECKTGGTTGPSGAYISCEFPNTGGCGDCGDDSHS